MKVTKHITINAPVQEVWHTAAVEFDKIGIWASNVSNSSEASDTIEFDDAQMAGRVCTTSLGDTYERFVDFSESDHHFTYAIEGDVMPFFVKKALNTWTLIPLSDDTTQLTMSAELDVNLFPGSLMRLPMAIQSKRLLQENLEELKYYIETGQPHPRKIDAMNN